MKFRKKPVVVEAVQFDPQVQPWPDGVKPWPDENGAQPRDMSFGYLQTVEGRIHVRAGDWVISGIAGERYICAPNIFDATYEPVEAQ